ncbi:MAG: hydroxyethylthiazole kinase [Paludibacteraceae bacterium]|jgi:hydroxyethylthiazole kinase|nr:hydroxyethylthiazole kinase [Paludibacteraceae bacterium]
MINHKHFLANFRAVREQSPLVHNITNYVAMNFSANALLAIGASPVMAHAAPEVADMAQLAGALVINIGTLDEKWIESMIIAGKAKQQAGGPIVLDPVGVGATAYRTQTAWQIIEACHPTIIRGNASEIMALLHADVKSKGVDSSCSSTDAVDSAKKLAERTGAVVVVSGEVDYITDGKQVETIRNGSAMMPRVTAMGCTASSMIGAFVAVHAHNPFEASLHAMAVMGIAGEMAAQQAKGPGSLLTHFIDTLYTLTETQLIDTLKQ